MTIHPYAPAPPFKAVRNPLIRLGVGATGRQAQLLPPGAATMQLAAGGWLVLSVAAFDGLTIGVTAIQTFGSTLLVAVIAGVVFAGYVFVQEQSYIGETGLVADSETLEISESPPKTKSWVRLIQIMFVSLIAAHAFVGILLDGDTNEQKALDNAAALTAFEVGGPAAVRIAALEGERTELQAAVDANNKAVSDASAAASAATAAFVAERATGPGPRSDARKADADRLDAHAQKEQIRVLAENPSKVARINEINGDVDEIKAKYAEAVESTDGPITELETLFRLAKERPATWFFWIGFTLAAMAVSMSGVLLAKKAVKGSLSDQFEAMRAVVIIEGQRSVLKQKLEEYRAQLDEAGGREAASGAVDVDEVDRAQRPTLHRRVAGVAALAVLLGVGAFGLDRDDAEVDVAAQPAESTVDIMTIPVVALSSKVGAPPGCAALSRSESLQRLGGGLALLAQDPSKAKATARGSAAALRNGAKGLSDVAQPMLAAAGALEALAVDTNAETVANVRDALAGLDDSLGATCGFD